MFLGYERKTLLNLHAEITVDWGSCIIEQTLKRHLIESEKCCFCCTTLVYFCVIFLEFRVTYLQWLWKAFSRPLLFANPLSLRFNLKQLQALYYFYIHTDDQTTWRVSCCNWPKKNQCDPAAHLSSFNTIGSLFWFYAPELYSFDSLPRQKYCTHWWLSAQHQTADSTTLRLAGENSVTNKKSPSML